MSIAMRALLLFSALVCNAAWALPDQAELDALLAQRLKAESEPACVALGVVRSRVAPVISTLCTDPAQRVDANSIFEIGSISKTFTATLLQLAVVRKQMTLDDALASYLPPDLTVPGRDDRQITLHTLVTHTSGLPRLPPGVPLQNVNPYENVHGADIEAALAASTLASTPGTHLAYSNFGFMLLSHVLGRAQQSDFAGLMHNQIAEPLGMKSTYVVDAELDARRVPGNDSRTHLGARWDFDPDVAGVGGIKSSLNDMLRYARANLTVETSRASTPLANALRAAHQVLYTEGATRIASAWFVRSSADGPIYWHNGGTGGYRSLIAFSPEQDVAVVLLVASEADMEDLGFHILDASVPLVEAHVALDLSAAELSACTGDYQLTPTLVFSLSGGNGRLFAQASGQPAFEVFSDRPDHFYFKELPAQFTLQRDAQGQVTGMRYTQSGRTLDAVPKLRSVAPADLSLEGAWAYVGRYRLPSGADFVVTSENGRLYAKLGQQPAFEVFRRAPDRFAYRVVEAELQFTRAPSGEVDALELHQNDRVQRAARVP